MRPLLLLLCCTFAASTAFADGEGSAKPLRVLFVGNSYVFTNDMPAMLRGLATAGGRSIVTVQETPPGCTLQRHAQGGGVARALKDKGPFDFAVIHEQSQRPSFSTRQVEREVLPFAKQLAGMARKAGATPVFMMTWGYRNGDRRNFPTDTYAAMQGRLATGYRAMAKVGKAKLAPVGLAWQQAMKGNAGLDLWGGDGSHPNAKGSYLAACVLYRFLTGESPVGNTYRARLSAEDAKVLQAVAGKLALRGVAKKTGAGSGAGSAPVAPGSDTLELTDGRVLKGKVMGASEDIVGFRFVDKGKSVTRFFKRTQIKKLTRGPK